MEYLRWMGNNFLLTIILAGILTEFILRLFRAGRIRAIRCPACGFKSPRVEKEQDDDE